MQDVTSAFTAILLVSLPNLQELRLSAAWLMEFPIFAGLEVNQLPNRRLPYDWKQEWLGPLLLPLLSKLKVSCLLFAKWVTE